LEQNSKNYIGKFNGLNPSPGAWFEYKKKRYKVLKAEINKKKGKIGELLDDKLTIACADKSISIKEIQKEGKNKINTKEFLIGNSFIKGTIF